MSTRIEGSDAKASRPFRGATRTWSVPIQPGETEAEAMARVDARADAWLADPHYKHPVTGERVEV